ncbi:MAG TPA: dTDP-4-dehydrorhamnose 3,5-epimerase [Pseudolysinimonas sp.]
MQIRELSIPDSFEVTTQQFTDTRGAFLEWYRFDALQEAVGHPLDLRQANLSVSKRGVVRGIHFADVPPGQAKYVTVPRGRIIDYVVDIRVGSPTFGTWDSVVLDDRNRGALYIGEGLGHAFIALDDDTVVSYLVSDVYAPGREHGVTPLDSELGLALPSEITDPILSEKDRDAPTLAQAAAEGLLPRWDDVQAFYTTLAAT